jgi:hypothetical protein
VRNEAFRADAVGRLPKEEEGLLDFRPVTTGTRTLHRGRTGLRGTVQNFHSIFAVIARRCNKLIQNTLFLFPRGFLVTRSDLI